MTAVRRGARTTALALTAAAALVAAGCAGSPSPVRRSGAGHHRARCDELDHHHLHAPLRRTHHRPHAGRARRRLVASGHRPASCRGFTSVSCISDVFCLAAGGGSNEADAAGSTGPGTVTAWDGATWGTSATYFAGAAGECPAAVAPGHRLHGRTHVRRGGRERTHIARQRDHLVGTGAVGPSGGARPRPGRPRPGPHRCAHGRGVLPVVAVLRLRRQHRARGHAPGNHVVGPPGVHHPGRAGHRRPLPVRPGRACRARTAASCTALIGDTELDWDGTAWTSAAGPWGAAGSRGHRRLLSRPRHLHRRPRDLGVEKAPGSGWSPPRVIDAGGGLDAVSCPTAEVVRGRRRLGQRPTGQRRASGGTPEGGAHPVGLHRMTAPVCRARPSSSAWC